jgi:hypothetical protein
MTQRKKRPAPAPRHAPPGRGEKLPDVPAVRPGGPAPHAATPRATGKHDAPAEAEPPFDDEAIRRMVEAAYT